MKSNVRIGEFIHPMETDDNYLNVVADNFDTNLVALLTCLIDPDDIVLDVGANIGMTSLLFARLVEKVVAFEAAPSTYKLLARNLALSGITNVDARNVGLGAEAGSSTLTYGSDNRSGGFVSEKGRPEAGHITEAISLTTLDLFMKDFPAGKYFIKIDVEGYEQYVIQGGLDFIKSVKPTVAMELNHFCLDVLQRITVPDFLDYMRSVFPYLYALEGDNSIIADLHVADEAYMVMHEHVVSHRFPNIVGSFAADTRQRLDGVWAGMMAGVEEKLRRSLIATPIVSQPDAIISASMPDGKVVFAGHLFTLQVQVRNIGAEAWTNHGTHPVHLSYHWTDAEGEMLVFEGLRTTLSSDVVLGGAAIVQDMDIIVPDQCGRARLVVTVVQEGHIWFDELGLDPLIITMDIQDLR